MGSSVGGVDEGALDDGLLDDGVGELGREALGVGWVDVVRLGWFAAPESVGPVVDGAGVDPVVLVTPGRGPTSFSVGSFVLFPLRRIPPTTAAAVATTAIPAISRVFRRF